MRDHREIVQDMKPLDAVDYLLGIIELNAPALTDVSASDIVGVWLRPIQGRIVATLLAANGGVVSKGRIFDAIYCDVVSADDLPDIKTLDMHVCLTRKRLKGSRFSINTHWGVGYSLAENLPASEPVEVVG